jgi:hypothetical protein
LNTIYHQYRAALPDEFVPPQHLHYRALVDRITGGSSWRRLDGLELRRVNSAFICCFERAEAYEFQLALWRMEPQFRNLLIETRTQLVADLAPLAAAEAERRAHYARWRECMATPLDIAAPSTLGLIQRMAPDDWHEIALRWDWNDGVEPLNWITSQHECDRATAVFVLCMGKPGDVAMLRERRGEDHGGFIRDVAARLEGGFYPNVELGLGLSMRQQQTFEAELATARATGVSPWRLPEDLLTHEGKRVHQPKYAVTGGRVHYQYEYWLAHVAPPKR